MGRRITEDILATLNNPPVQSVGNNITTSAAYTTTSQFTSSGVSGRNLCAYNYSTAGSYNVDTNAWTATATIPTNVSNNCGSGGGSNGYVYSFGGGNTATTYGYNPNSNAWVTYANDNYARNQALAIPYGNLVFVFDGYNGSNYNYNTGYNTVSNAWTTYTGDLSSRANTFGGNIGSIIYVAGGYTSANTNTHAGYNVGSNAWTSYALVNNVKSSGACGVLSGVFFTAVGQGGGGGFINNIDGYNPSTNAWTAYTGDTYARENVGYGAFDLDSTLYIVGGYGNAVGSTATNNWSVNNQFVLPQNKYSYMINGSIYQTLQIPTLPSNTTVKLSKNNSILQKNRPSGLTSLQLSDDTFTLDLSNPTSFTPRVQVARPPHR